MSTEQTELTEYVYGGSEDNRNYVSRGESLFPVEQSAARRSCHHIDVDWGLHHRVRACLTRERILGRAQLWLASNKEKDSSGFDYCGGEAPAPPRRYCAHPFLAP